MKKFFLVDLKSYTDERGELIPFELNKNCPFDIKRAFTIANVPSSDIVRGNHINVKSKCFIIPLQGSVTIDCKVDDTVETYILNSNHKGLFIDIGVYRKLYNFSNDAILLCLADNYYEQKEYIV